MDNSPIIENIRKLLVLANSNNKPEAALAAGHPQRLLTEQNLDMANIEATARPDEAERWAAVASKTHAQVAAAPERGR